MRHNEIVAALGALKNRVNAFSSSTSTTELAAARTQLTNLQQAAQMLNLAADQRMSLEVNYFGPIDRKLASLKV